MNRITLRLRYGRDRNRRLSPKHVRVTREGESLPRVAVQATSSCCGDGVAASDSDMLPWFRTPSTLTLLNGSHRATRNEATVDLLLRWSREDDPTVRDLAGLWGWSKDAAHRLSVDMNEWAGRNGAPRPKRSRPETPIKHERDKPRTDEHRQTPAVEWLPDERRTSDGRWVDPSRARVEDSSSLSPQREKKREEPEEKKEADKGPRSAPALPPVSVPVADGGKVAVADDSDLLRAWAALREFRLPGKRDLTPSRRARLVAAMKRHGADVLVRVGRWVATSKHPRATNLRENWDVDTLLFASKLQAYVELSADPEVNPRSLAAFARWRALSGQSDEPTPALVAPIIAAIEQIGEAETIAVIEWVLTGTDDKARFLQTKNVRSIQAVLNPDKLHGRRDLARAAKPVRIGDVHPVTPTTATGSPEADDGVNLGPNAFLGYSPTDHLRRTRRPPPT